MNGLPSIIITTPAWSPGLGCSCNNKLPGDVPEWVSEIWFGPRRPGLAGANDYDQIRIGGGTYSANQLVGKSIRANANTKTYRGTTGDPAKVITTVKGGEIIGKVASYIRPDQSVDGRSWLMFDLSQTQQSLHPDWGYYFFVPNELVSDTGLKDQGTKTVTEEIKAEEDAKLKADSPMEYYIKKYAGKVLLGVGIIVLVNSIARESIKGSFSKNTQPT